MYLYVSNIVISYSCPKECVCHGLSIDCSGQITCSQPIPAYAGVHSTTLDLPASTRVLNLATASDTFRKLNVKKHNEWFIEILNISYCNITWFANNFFKPFIRLRILDMSFNNIKRLTSGLFKPLANLERLIFVGNFETLTLEADAFKGTTSLASLEMKSLHITKIARMAFASGNLSSLKIYGSTIEHIDDYFLEGSSVKTLLFNSSKIETFTKTMFHAANEMELLVTDAYKFCCVRPSHLPEESCLPPKNEFTFCNDLIDSDVLRILIWVVAGFIVLTNFVSIIYRIKDKDDGKTCFGMFASNLAISDVLIGVYLIIIGATDVIFRGVYIYRDEVWRWGVWCKVASVLSVTSCETSALFIVLITVERYVVIKYPFKKNIITRRTGVLLVCSVWILGMIASLIPIVFMEGGLYSQTGICLALPITRAKFEGWGYSFGLFVVFNSLLCLSVAFGQLSIYKEIKASTRAVAHSKSKSSNASRVAGKLLLVSISDFLCRFPVSLLGKVS